MDHLFKARFRNFLVFIFLRHQEKSLLGPWSVGILMTMCFAYAGCLKVSDKNKISDQTPPSVGASNAPDNQPHAPIDPMELDKFLTYEVIPDAAPQRYRVIFHWPNFTTPAFVQFRLGAPLLQLKTGQIRFEQIVDHNQSLDYTIDVYDENSELLTEVRRNVVIPRDWVVDPKNNALSADLNDHIGRLYLHAGTPLTTNGFHLHLTALAIISDNGEIQTFPENTKAAPNSPGISGGKIEIEAQAARGELRISMRGTDGGDGIDGAKYTERAPDGNISGFGLVSTCGGPMSSHICCTKIGDPATRGQDGLAGRNGSSGMNGGNSGYLKLAVENGENFHFEALPTPGSGGRPGIGSAGQLGGNPGGQSPSIFPTLNCSGPPSTTAGVQGPKGVDGAPGMPGTAEAHCIEVKDAKINECGG